MLRKNDTLLIGRVVLASKNFSCMYLSWTLSVVITAGFILINMAMVLFPTLAYTFS